MGNTYGNLQKVRDGKRTYAITPHIPGGFVSPETLEKIAGVARKYHGVLKITSGQRILITNLQDEDLPAIWDELKMEPAVKYKILLRTLKCVQQDFVKDQSITLW